MTSVFHKHLWVNAYMTNSYQNNDDLLSKKSDQTLSEEGIVRFGERLKDAIGEESILSFAKRCGLSDTLVGKYIKGQSYPGIDKMPLLAKATGKSIAWFFEEDSNQSSIEGQKYDREELQEWWRMISKSLTVSELAAVVEIFKKGGKDALLANGLNASQYTNLPQSTINTALMLESLNPEVRKEILAQYGIAEQNSPVTPDTEPHKKAV